MKDKISEQDLALLNRGFELDSEGKTEEALEAYELAAQANTLCAPAAYTVRGVIYEEDGQFAKAEREYKRALELVPFSSKPSYYLHGLLYKTARVDEAIAEGIRFFKGRKSSDTNQLILDYRKSLENLLTWSDDEFADSYDSVFGIGSPSESGS